MLNNRKINELLSAIYMKSQNQDVINRNIPDDDYGGVVVSPLNCFDSKNFGSHMA